MVQEVVSSPTKASLVQRSCNEDGTITVKSLLRSPRSPKKKPKRVVKPVDDDNTKQRGQVWVDLRASMANKKGLFRGLKRNRNNRNSANNVDTPKAGGPSAPRCNSGEKLSDTSTETPDSNQNSPQRDISVTRIPPTAVDVDTVDEQFGVDAVVNFDATVSEEIFPPLPSSHHHRRIQPVPAVGDHQVYKWGRDFKAPLEEDRGAETNNLSTDAKRANRRRKRRNRRRSKERGSLSPAQQKIAALDNSLSRTVEVFEHSWGDLGDLQHSFTGLKENSIPTIEAEDFEETSELGKKISKKDSFSSLDSFSDENGKWKDILSMATMDHTLSVKDFDKSSLKNVLGEEAVAADDDPFGFFYDEDDHGGETATEDSGTNLLFSSGSEDPMFKVMEQLLLDDGVEISDDTDAELEPVLDDTGSESAEPLEGEAEVVLDDKIKHTLEASSDKVDADDDDSFGTAPEVEEHTETSEVEEKPRSKRVIRFADEQGLPVATVMQSGDEHEGGPEMARLVMLLLSPKDRKFEFLHAEYQLGAKTTVQDVIDQMPVLAVDILFQESKFATLYRTGKGAHELINTLPMSECGLEKGEVVLGVIEGYSGKEIIQSALPLLVNPKIAKAVKHARRTGRGLKYIMTNSEWQEYKRENNQKKETRGEINREDSKSSEGGATEETNSDSCPERQVDSAKNPTVMEEASPQTDISSPVSKWDPDESLSEFCESNSGKTITAPTNSFAVLTKPETKDEFAVLTKPEKMNGFAVLTKPETKKDSAEGKEDEVLLEMPDIPLEDSAGIPADHHKQQKVIQMLQAGLIATFGIFYSMGRK